MIYVKNWTFDSPCTYAKLPASCVGERAVGCGGQNLETLDYARTNM